MQTTPLDCLLVRILRDPVQAAGLDLAQWDCLMRQARKGFLLAQLDQHLRQAGVADCIPALVRRHMDSDLAAVAAQNRAVRWEVYCLQRTLARIGLPLVLLKGAAYVVSEQAMVQGRMFSDMDIMVPQERLAEVEHVLMRDGWSVTEQGAYDQRYYREWMHELPPMSHSRRSTALDVHHNIIPPTSRYRLDASLLLSQTQAIAGCEGVEVLSSEDRVLHSAAHLFLEGEFDRGLRDVVDMALMLREFSVEPEFWGRLSGRANELGLSGPVFYALSICRRLLAVIVPDSVIAHTAKGAGPVWLRRVLEACFLRALIPAHRSCDIPLAGLCRWLLYVRSHYIKMPFRLLIPHLLYKAWARRAEKSA